MPARPLWSEKQIGLLIRGLRTFGRDYDRIQAVFLPAFNTTQIKNKHYYLKITHAVSDDELNTIRYSPKGRKRAESPAPSQDRDSMSTCNVSFSSARITSEINATEGSAREFATTDVPWIDRSCPDVPRGCGLEIDLDFIRKLAALLQ